MAQQQKPPAEFSDAELIELINSPTVKPEDLALLTPGEKQRYQALRQSKEHDATLTGKMGNAMDAANDVAVGAVKGAGQTVTNLGRLVHKIPGVTPAVDWLYGDSGDGQQNLAGLVTGDAPRKGLSSRAFEAADETLKPANTSQAIGKGAEQIGEFFIPTGEVGLAQRGAAELVTHLPKAAGTVRKLATDAAWKLAPVIDNALSTGAVAMAHGDENPQYVAGTQAGIQTAGIGLGQLTKLLETKVGSQYAPILAAILVMKAVSALGGGLGETMGSGLAANTATRTLARRALQQPGAAGKLLWGAEKAGERVGTLGAGIVDETRTRRRQP